MGVGSSAEKNPGFGEFKCQRLGCSDVFSKNGTQSCSYHVSCATVKRNGHDVFLWYWCCGKTNPSAHGCHTGSHIAGNSTELEWDCDFASSDLGEYDETNDFHQPIYSRASQDDLGNKGRLSAGLEIKASNNSLFRRPSIGIRKNSDLAPHRIEWDVTVRKQNDTFGFKVVPNEVGGVPGVVVTHVGAHSPSNEMIRPGDQVYQIDGKDVTSCDTFESTLHDAEDGQAVTLRISRVSTGRNSDM